MKRRHDPNANHALPLVAVIIREIVFYGFRCVFRVARVWNAATRNALVTRRGPVRFVFGGRKAKRISPSQNFTSARDGPGKPVFHIDFRSGVQNDERATSALRNRNFFGGRRNNGSRRSKTRLIN